MTHLFTTVPDVLFEQNRMSKDIADFIKINGWAMQNYKYDTVNEDVAAVFHQARERYQNEEFFMMGESFAEICSLLKDSELSFEALEEEVNQIDDEKYGSEE